MNVLGQLPEEVIVFRRQFAGQGALVHQFGTEKDERQASPLGKRNGPQGDLACTVPAAPGLPHLAQHGGRHT
jgi:hypothetical protein